MAFLIGFGHNILAEITIMKHLFLIAILASVAVVANAQITSVYTDLDADKCKTLELAEDEGGLYKGECKGVGGYKLYSREGDLRMSIDVVAPGNRVSQLQFWNVSSAFSYLGAKAEWRLKKGSPIALIVRFNISENPEDSSKITSLLVVSKVSKTGSCVTDVVRPQANQNAVARRLADASATKPCKFPDIED